MFDCEAGSKVTSNGGSQMFAKYLINFTSTNKKNYQKTLPAAKFKQENKFKKSNTVIYIHTMGKWEKSDFLARNDIFIAIK